MIDSDIFQSLKTLSESQLKTIEGLVKVIDALSMRVTFLEGVVIGFQSRFEALEKKQ